MADKITKKSDSQIIHEARGLCWHRPSEGDWIGCTCRDCGWKFIKGPDVTPDYPTDHAEYLKALNEFKEGWDSQEWIIATYTDTAISSDFNEDLLDPVTGVPIIANFLRGRKG